jgi:small-conductance mechanosensitive channel
MDQAISEYQKWKQQGASLRSQAKHAMETRFRDLLVEAAQIAQEYHTDFGTTLKPPVQITAFRYKAAAKGAVKKAGPKPVVKAENPKVVELQKRLAQTTKKLEAVKAAGKDTKNLDDKIYEIEDAIRLATDAS